jgi:hypothetical protein
MQLFKDTHITKLELLSNATTIDSALNYIRNKQEQQHQNQKKHMALDSTGANGDDSDDPVYTQLHHQPASYSDDSQLSKEGGKQTVF